MRAVHACAVSCAESDARRRAMPNAGQPPEPLGSWPTRGGLCRRLGGASRWCCAPRDWAETLVHLLQEDQLVEWLPGAMLVSGLI